MGVARIRTIVFWGMYRGSPILGKSHLVLMVHLCVKQQATLSHTGTVTRASSVGLGFRAGIFGVVNMGTKTC